MEVSLHETIFEMVNERETDRQIDRKRRGAKARETGREKRVLQNL